MPARPPSLLRSAPTRRLHVPRLQGPGARGSRGRDRRSRRTTAAAAPPRSDVSYRSQQASDRPDDLRPPRLLRGQLAPSSRREAIELQLPPARILLPSRGNPSATRQPLKRRIQRPVFHLQHVFGCSLNVFRNTVPVSRSEEQGPQNHQVQCALQQRRPVCPRHEMVDNLPHECSTILAARLPAWTGASAVTVDTSFTKPGVSELAMEDYGACRSCVWA